jgi:hypothetical protein
MNPLIKQWIVDRADVHTSTGAAFGLIVASSVDNNVDGFLALCGKMISIASDPGNKELDVELRDLVEDMAIHHWQTHAKEHEAEILEEMGDEIE